MLKGKRIILAVSGSIAAYKAAFLTRLLVKAKAEVRVIMTPAAANFITPLTLSTLSKNDVLTEVISKESWNNHVEFGLWADAMIIAPATANTLARLANGICDNIIGAVYLSARCPVFLAPAMDVDMWRHPAVKANVRQLQSFGNHIIPVGNGELASGLVGDGRMAEPEKILEFLSATLHEKKNLQGIRMLITAGPTYEPIDPVRFIGNRSSGKMGIAIARAAKTRGAEVRLILGPSALSPGDGIDVIRVKTAREMHEEAFRYFPHSDVAVLAAAVADYRPESASTQKIKKKSAALDLKLVKNPDIAADLGRQKQAGQFTIGFALETNDEENNAIAKLQKKNFDFIVLNSLNETGAGFNHDTNKVTILHADGHKQEYSLKSKDEVAEDILNNLQELLS